MRYHLNLSEWLLPKGEEKASADEDVEKREPLCTVGGNVILCSHFGKQYGGSSKTKTMTTMWSNNSASGYLYKENKNTNLEGYMHPYNQYKKAEIQLAFFFPKQERSEDNRTIATHSFSGKSLWTKSLISQLRCFQCETATFLHMSGPFQSQRKAMPKNAQAKAQLHSFHMLAK